MLKKIPNEAAVSLDAEAYVSEYVEVGKRARTKLGSFFSII